MGAGEVEELHSPTIFQGVRDQICVPFHLCHLLAVTWNKQIPLKNGAGTIRLLDRGVVRCGGLDEDQGVARRNTACCYHTVGEEQLLILSPTGLFPFP